MFHADLLECEPNALQKYSIKCGDEPMAFASVIDCWATDSEFRAFFSKLLAESPFEAFRWETPPLHQSTVSRHFEFVLLNAPRFVKRRTDHRTFASYFSSDDQHEGIVRFASLGGDAKLIVPSPRTNVDAYGHLAAFVRLAPEVQIDMLWRVVGEVAQDSIGMRPVWLSTAGGGVAWLHVRFDETPKYYGYAPYRETP